MKKWLVFAATILIFFFYFFLDGTQDTYRAEKVPTRSQEKTTPLLFTGDIMMGRYVEGLGEEYDDPGFMFNSTKDLLQSHVTIANLEGPIPAAHVPTPLNGFRFSFPSSTPAILKENGIAAVSLANNHMFDHGRDGWVATKQALDVANIAHFGGYTPTEDDYIEVPLGKGKAVVYGITMIATGWDEEQALLVTEKLRREHPQDYLIAFLHWGDEYLTQNKYQQAFAHKLIDKGVDTIVGSHPHVVQGIELYRGKPIFYSLGNFVFDQYFNEEVKKGYLLELDVDQGKYVYRIIPVYSPKANPSVVQGEKAENILQRIKEQSDSSLQNAIGEGELRFPIQE